MYVNVLQFIYSYYYVEVSRRGMQSFANRVYWLDELEESMSLDFFNDEDVQAIFILS